MSRAARRRIAMLLCGLLALSLEACGERTESRSESSANRETTTTIRSPFLPGDPDRAPLYVVEVRFSTEATSVVIGSASGPENAAREMTCAVDSGAVYDSELVPGFDGSIDFDLVVRADEPSSFVECHFDSGELGFSVRHFTGSSPCGPSPVNAEPDVYAILGEMHCSSQEFPEPFEAIGISLMGTLVIEQSSGP